MYHEMYHRHPELLRAQRSDTAEELTGPLTETVAERMGCSAEVEIRPAAIVQAALSIMQAAIRFQWSTNDAAQISEVVTEGFSALTLR